MTGGSRAYVQALELEKLGNRLHTGTPVVQVERDGQGVRLHFAGGTSEAFDAVVIATHADEALALLAEPSHDERELLGTWRYSTNQVVLHTDTELLPRRPAARAAWSYLLRDCTQPTENVSVSYYLNKLQSLDTEDDFIVTLNPDQPPRPERVLRSLVATHPLYTQESLDTHAGLPRLQGQRQTYFCGAYHGWGFHEDGLLSAIRVSELLGVEFG